MIICIAISFRLFAQHDNKHENKTIVINSGNKNYEKDTTIKYSIIKGIITAGNPSTPVQAKISVIDKSDSSGIKYVYNSNPVTGKYLMILSPGKSYDMIVQPQGHKAYYVQIQLPVQKYFYELFQEIHLTPVFLDTGEQIGEEINVTNIFYDILNPKFECNKNTQTIKDYSKLLQLIETMIEETDSVALEHLELLATTDSLIYKSKNKNYNKLIELIKNAIESTDTTSLNNLSASSIISDEKTKHTYFFDSESKKSNQIMHVFGKDTIWTFAPLNTIKNTTVTNENTKERTEITVHTIYFGIAETQINEQYITELDEIVNLMKFNKKIKLEINGYADKSGDPEFNLRLSKKRAESVKEYFVSKKINGNRITTKGKGEITNKKENNRKAIILVYE